MCRGGAGSKAGQIWRSVRSTKSSPLGVGNRIATGDKSASGEPAQLAFRRTTTPPLRHSQGDATVRPGYFFFTQAVVLKGDGDQSEDQCGQKKWPGGSHSTAAMNIVPALPPMRFPPDAEQQRNRQEHHLRFREQRKDKRRQ